MPRPGAGGSEVYVGKTAPLQPATGDFWYDTSATTLNFHNGVAWLAVAVSAGAFDTLSNSISVLSQAVSVLSVAVSVHSAEISVLSQAVSVLSVAVSVVSQKVSVLSQAVSVLSQAVSVLSNTVSVISAAVDTISQQVSVLSQAHSVLSANVSVLSDTHSVLSQAHSVLSQAHSVLSQAHSVLSAGIGLVQIKVVSNTQTLSATTSTKLSGLSADLSAAAVYQIDGKIIYNLSVAGGVTFGITAAVSAAQPAGARLMAGQALSSREVAHQQGFPWLISTTPATTSTFILTIDGVVKTSAAATGAGALQVYAFLSAAGTDLNIKAGSYLRAYKIG